MIFKNKFNKSINIFYLAEVKNLKLGTHIMEKSNILFNFKIASISSMNYNIKNKS